MDEVFGVGWLGSGRLKKEGVELLLCKIQKEAHKIEKTKINENALKIISRLNSFGYQGYIVGGAVRDLLSGREPKDFDVITNATPNQVRRIFKNSRIIGKRFKLVHVYFDDFIVETATFRADPPEERDEILIRRDNAYGKIEDDVIRRDFSFNALYYDPVDEVILDYVSGYQDIRNGVVRTLKEEKISFLEDPVRMLRAVKYATLLGFELSEQTKKSIRKYGKEITKCSQSRLYEEYNKILRSDHAAAIFSALYECQLLKYLIPFFYKELDGKGNPQVISDLLVIDTIPKVKDKFEYEIYWGAILYRGMISDRKLNECLKREQRQEAKFFSEQEKGVSFLELSRKYVTERLFPLNMPRKTCEDIGKAFFIFVKYGNKEDCAKIKQFKSQYAFSIAVRYFELFCKDEELLQYVKSIHVKKSRKIKHPVKKRDKVFVPRYYPYKGKKFVETKKSGSE